MFTWFRSLGFGNNRSIPSLDGLRAVAIVFVLVAHLSGTRRFPLKLTLDDYKLGEFGVRMFFVISGFLITSMFLKELQKTGGISISHFYFRRILRLFPAAYFLIAVVAILSSMHLVTLARNDLLYSIFYSMNYHSLPGWPLGHFWSLAIEEQFYVLWPVILVFLAPKRATNLLIAMLLVAPVCRLLTPYVGPLFSFLIWSDALATGCLLALLREKLFANRSYARMLASRWCVLVPVAALAANYIPFTKIHWSMCQVVMNLGIVVTIDWCIRNSKSLAGRILNAPSVCFVGVLSYSLYLWQQLFLNRSSDSPLCAFPLNLLLTISAGLASYLLIEVPFLRLRALTSKGQVASVRPEVAGV